MSLHASCRSPVWILCAYLSPAYLHWRLLLVLLSQLRSVIASCALLHPLCQLCAVGACHINGMLGLYNARCAHGFLGKVALCLPALDTVHLLGANGADGIAGTMGAQLNWSLCTCCRRCCELLQADLVAEASLPVVDGGGPVDAFCGWFDVTFQGSPEHLADDPVKLSTGPDATGPTHWGQQVFMMHPSVDCAAGDNLQVKVHVSRQKENHRLLELQLDVKVEGNSVHATKEVRQLNWHID